ncbi:MAG: hypothetical protein LBH25_06000 [Fibromonadaceae bacterium]|jgi:hypothetical protein|nr:hypothetical protein [Fibromonadaceae bacterium]
MYTTAMQRTSSQIASFTGGASMGDPNLNFQLNAVPPAQKQLRIERK